MLIRSLALAAVLLLALPGCGPAAPPAGPPPVSPPTAPGAAPGPPGDTASAPGGDTGDAGDARQVLLAALNAERKRAGLAALQLDPRLVRVAQEHAEAVGRSGVLQLDVESDASVRERMEKAGYPPARWVESAVSSEDDLPSMVAEWRRREPEAFRQVMDPSFHEVGIGLARLEGAPLYLFLLAESRGERFARQTVALSDLAAVRAAMLERVNAERRQAGVAPLRVDPRLERAAQLHAEDMLRRGYFAHESPEKTTPRTRILDTGYRARAVAENLAEGQTSVREVMDGWMKSPGHRRNLLDRIFVDFGLGLALGRGGNGEQAVWVQEFGKEQ